jgi:hypothetical protein
MLPRYGAFKRVYLVYLYVKKSEDVFILGYKSPKSLSSGIAKD